MTDDDELPHLGHFTTDEHGNIKPIAAWVPDSNVRQRTAAAFEARRKPIADVCCPKCRRTIVGTVFATPNGPLYVADIPSASATRLAIEWSAPSEQVGRIPAGTSPVRVLVEEPEPGGRGRCAGWCAKHGQLEVDVDMLHDAVRRYLDDGTRRTVPAKHSATR